MSGSNELAERFNQVDATYWADLREMNELNFSRFDAKVEQRFAEQDARIDRRFAEFEVRIEKRFAEFEVRIEKRIAEFEVRIEKRLAAFEVSIRAELEQSLREQTRFLFLGWITLFATIVPLWFR